MQFLNTYQVHLVLDSLEQCFEEMHSKRKDLRYLQADGTDRSQINFNAFTLTLNVKLTSLCAFVKNINVLDLYLNSAG